MHGGPVVAPISSMHYQMMAVLGGLGVDMGWLLGLLGARGCVCYYLFPNLLLSM